MAELFTPGQTIPSEQFGNLLAAEHGGLKSQVVVPAPSSATFEEKAAWTQNPLYRYYFSDGTFIEARASENGLDYEVVKYQPSPQAVKAEAAATRRTDTPPQEKNEGGRRWVWNSDTGRWDDVGPAPLNPTERTAQADENVSAPPTQKFILRRVNGEMVQELNPNYVAPKDDSAMTEYQRESLDLQKQSANKPSSVDAPATKAKLTVYNPATGEYEARDNPSYDAALAASEQLKERLSTAITLNKITADQAKDQYQRWFDLNITVPFKQNEEARARAQEIRLAQEAEDRRQQFSANYEQQRATTAMTAGQRAAENEIALLPSRVGKAFPGQLASSLNSLAKGSSAGVNFTPDAFEYKTPDIEGIAARATAKALKNISPAAAALAAAGSRPLNVAQYGSGTGPIAPPPEAPPGIDIQQMLAELGAYSPGGQAAA